MLEKLSRSPYLEDLCRKLSDESRPVSRKEKREKIYFMELTVKIVFLTMAAFVAPNILIGMGSPVALVMDIDLIPKLTLNLTVL